MSALPWGQKQIELELPAGPLSLFAPRDPEELLEAMMEAPPDPDDKMPYWAELWASSVALAERIEEGLLPVQGRRCLELGCGLGLPSLAAARAGAEATASDWDAEALLYVQASAARAGLQVQTTRLDWRHPPEADYEILLLADVLYEPRNVPDLQAALPKLLAPGGSCWLSDPGRVHLEPFLAGLSGWSVERQRVRVKSAAIPREQAELSVIQLRAR